MEFREYPKWLHREGQTSVLVRNADEEVHQLTLWGDEEPATVVSRAPEAPVVIDAGEGAPVPADPEPNPFAKFDHDGDGKPGGSRKGGWPKGKPRKV